MALTVDRTSDDAELIIASVANGQKEATYLEQRYLNSIGWIEHQG